MVALPAAGGLAVDDEVAGSIDVAVSAAHVIRSLYPDFYAESVEGLPIKEGTLLGVCAALFQLVEERSGLPLRWPKDDLQNPLNGGGLDGTPEETLWAYDWVTDEYMLGSVAEHVGCPRPEFFGLGVQTYREHESHDPSLLVMALWRVFSRTEWALGVELKTFLEDIPPAAATACRRLPVLPPATDLDQFIARLDLPVWLPGEPLEDRRNLLAYAVGQTDNPLANASSEEAEWVHMGELDRWSWSQVDDLAELSRQAQALQARWEQWEALLMTDVAGQLAALGEAVRRAIPPRTPIALVDLLTDELETEDDAAPPIVRLVEDLP